VIIFDNSDSCSETSKSRTSNIRAFQVLLGSYVNPKSIVVCSREMECRSWSGIGLFMGSYVDLKTTLVLIIGINLGGVDRSKTRLGFHFEVKVRSLSSLDLVFSLIFRILVGVFWRKWPGLISPHVTL